MRDLRTIAAFLITCAFGLALVSGSVLLVVLALTFFRRVLAPAAFIALSSLMLAAFCAHLALWPDGWLFRQEGGWRLGPRGWINVAARLLAAGAVLFSAKLMLNEVLARYPEKFWLAVVAAGILIFGAAAVADHRGRQRR